jgi:cytochrome c oxidase subunit III
VADADADVHLLLMPVFLANRQQRLTFALLCADFVVFLSLFASYVYRRHETPEWPTAFHFASGLMAFAITLFVLAASFAMFFAARRQAMESYDVSLRLVVAAIAVWGSAFILIAMEWMRLVFVMEVGFSTNPWGIPAVTENYFVLTGFFALHLIAGMIYLTVLAVKIRSTDAGAAALFVHFTSLVWLVLFVGIYLAGTDLQGI